MSSFRLPEIIPDPWPAVEILDIGAMPEGRPRFQGLIDLGLASVNGFEPQAGQRAKLSAAAGWKRVFPYVLGDGSPATFHVTRYPGCSSLLEPDPAVIDLFSYIGAGSPDGNFYVVRRETVETHRLDDIDGCPGADYVKIDVQGGELLVLSNGVEKLSEAVVIECEVEFVPLYKNQPLFSDIQAFLRQQGFWFHKFLDIAGRTYRPVTLPNMAETISQGLWADAIFIRDISCLGNISETQLLKMALILYEVYASFDLVLHLLIEYDRRSGEKRENIYAEALRAGGGLRPLYMNLKTHT